MTKHPLLVLPWRCGQRIDWLSHGRAQTGRLTTWRGPSEAGVYVLTVSVSSEGEAGGLVTLHAPGPEAITAQIREVARYA